MRGSGGHTGDCCLQAQGQDQCSQGEYLSLFYTDECEKCGDLEATLETVACKHRGRINVARVSPSFDSLIFFFDTIGFPAVFLIRIHLIRIRIQSGSRVLMTRICKKNTE